jgi:hypothetical protein
MPDAAGENARALKRLVAQPVSGPNRIEQYTASLNDGLKRCQANALLLRRIGSSS